LQSTYCVLSFAWTQTRESQHPEITQLFSGQTLSDCGGPDGVKDDVWILMAPESWYSEDYSKK